MQNASPKNIPSEPLPKPKQFFIYLKILTHCKDAEEILLPHLLSPPSLLKEVEGKHKEPKHNCQSIQVDQLV